MGDIEEIVFHSTRFALIDPNMKIRGYYIGTESNDVKKLVGPPSSISEFDNKWFYIEREKTNQSIVKLGTKKINKNNVLVLEFNNLGILKNKEILTIDNMNDVKLVKSKTQKKFKQNNLMYNVFSSFREKINAPTRNRKK